MNGNIIIGNLCTLVAMSANAFSATRKDSKSVLRVQNISQLVYCISGIVLEGYSASVQNVVSILRNIAAIRNVKSKTLEWVLVIAGLVLGIACNNRGVIGLLPVLGTLQYTLVIFQCKDNQRALKASFMISSIFFVVFNFCLYNFVGAVSDLVVAITTFSVLVKGNKKKA